MAVNITSNKKNQSAVIHVSSANANIIVAGNNSVSNIAMAGETLTGAYITQAFVGSASGIVTLTRGGILVGAWDSTGHYDFAGTGMALTVNQTANLEIVLPNPSSYIFFEVQKVGNLTANSEYFQSQP